jgi:general secretion pathway protein A
MYNAYFGLQEAAFNVTCDPRFFYANPDYQEAYASLLYGIRERKGLIVLIGEAGTGKTTLLKVLMNNAEATVRWVYICQTILTIDELIDFMCQELGLIVPDAGRLQKIQTLHDLFLKQSQQGGTTVLVLDEAQNVGTDNLEQLRLLLNLETPTDKLLQIVLAGQPALEQQLDYPCLSQLKQRVAVQYRLPRLTNREVGTYIYHRLRVAGYSQQRLYSRKAIQRIAHYADGIPRVIHVLCDNALLQAYGVSRKRVTAEMIDEVAADYQLGVLPAAPAANHLPIRRWGHHIKQTGNTGEKHTSEGSKRRRVAWAGVTILLVLPLAGALYSSSPSQVWNRLSYLTFTIENLFKYMLERLGLLF